MSPAWPNLDITGRVDWPTAISRNGRYGTLDRVTASVRLDVEGPDDVAPLLGFLGDEPAKVCGRNDKRRHTQNGEPRFYLGIGEARVDLLVELVDDVRRRVLGYADAIPVARLIARHELTHGRDVRQRVRAGRGRHRQRPQPARLDLLDRGRRGGEHDLPLTTE